MNKKWVITTLILVLFVAAGVTYHLVRNGKGSSVDKANATATSQRMPNVLPISAYIIKEKPLTDGITTSGVLIPDEEVNLSFETSGKIVSIYFQEGFAVRKGDLLAKVNDSNLQAQLARFEAQRQLAEDKVYRRSTLLESDAVSKEALEESETELAILLADIELVKANIAFTELRAPFDGIIGLRLVSEGTFVNNATVIATLTKVSPLKVEFPVGENYASQIGKGTNLTFQVTGDLRTFDASVYAIDSYIDTDIHTLKVRALYPNARRELLPGRYVNIYIKLVEIPDALVIPSQALIKELGIDKVFLYKDGKAEPATVDIGLRTDAEVQIVRGLHVGDTVIVSGTLQLRQGLDVSIDSIIE